MISTPGVTEQKTTPVDKQNKVSVGVQTHFLPREGLTAGELLTQDSLDAWNIPKPGAAPLEEVEALYAFGPRVLILTVLLPPPALLFYGMGVARSSGSPGPEKAPLAKARVAERGEWVNYNSRKEVQGQGRPRRC